ncbi:unnamed protein product [Rhizoctonia solani]|uniref:chitin deacetylase n=3 Tax=Rhizoctonia solani TaxID=456999 RepID=A0A8H3CSB6_9AGAM|nr:chitin deacetylase [Rhizoctonia solani AG-3 Rhs1AP]KEP46344.1 chitin deacetylase [Rhizoctonia solani 123E]CAE6492187.1 unnamed protein product [Rhizoctonia solani]
MLALAALCSALVSTAAASALPGRWYRDPAQEHPVHKLFSRQTTLAPVGSPEWAAKYPQGALNVSSIPKPWLDAMNKAIADGRIPSTSTVPIATTAGVYRSSAGKTLDGGKAPICSSTVGCKDNTQIYDVPDGIVAISFDDGPLPASRTLYKFLRDHNQKVTHFFIGANILENPEIFKEAFEVNGNDIAVHTWSHPQMTTLSNEMVLAELGWTCQIIHDSTGGRLPLYWRPSYGDSDARVRAIAKEVLGLETVIWNDDTDDWKIPEGSQTLSGAKSVLTKAYAGPKSPGLNILEHELSNSTVRVFTDTYPLIAQNGWQGKSIPDAMGTDWYLNAKDNTSPVTEMSVGSGASAVVPSATPSASSATGTNGGASAPTSTPAQQTSGATRLVPTSLALVMVALLALV